MKSSKDYNPPFQEHCSPNCSQTCSTQGWPRRLSQYYLPKKKYGRERRKRKHSWANLRSCNPNWQGIRISHTCDKEAPQHHSVFQSQRTQVQGMSAYDWDGKTCLSFTLMLSYVVWAVTTNSVWQNSTGYSRNVYGRKKTDFQKTTSGDGGRVSGVWKSLNALILKNCLVSFLPSITQWIHFTSLFLLYIALKIHLLPEKPSFISEVAL